MWDGSRAFGLETPTALCRALGDPQDRVKTVHVAGTNGKGSVCAMTAAMLYAAGYSVGQFTSPHLVDPVERCLINGEPCDRERFDSALCSVADAAHRSDLNPSYFEVSAAASFVEFARREVDFAVVEVGLGGRLDATNVIRRPQLSVITSISFDHMHLLGDTLADIAREKAGIIKAGVPVVAAPAADEALEVIAAVAAERDCPLHVPSAADIDLAAHSRRALRGRHQIANAALAAAAGRLLGLSEEQIGRGFISVRWPARLELISSGDDQPPILLDAAHNEDGIRTLLSYLSQEAPREIKFSRMVIVVGMLQRKDWRTMTKMLRAFAAESAIPVSFAATGCNNKTSVAPAELAAQLGAALVEDEPAAALEAARSRAGRSGLVVVAGSSYLAGALRPLVTAEPFRSVVYSP